MSGADDLKTEYESLSTELSSVKASLIDDRYSCILLANLTKTAMIRCSTSSPEPKINKMFKKKLKKGPYSIKKLNIYSSRMERRRLMNKYPILRYNSSMITFAKYLRIKCVLCAGL